MPVEPHAGARVSGQVEYRPARRHLEAVTTVSNMPQATARGGCCSHAVVVKIAVTAIRIAAQVDLEPDPPMMKSS